MWSYNERRLGPHDRQPWRLRIGASSLAWREGELAIRIDERTTPFPMGNPFGRPVRGVIRVRPRTLPGLELPIDGRGHHRWWPIAPLAEVEVAMNAPDLRFVAHGYCDANAGNEPLWEGFDSWSWSRVTTADRAHISYDARERGGHEVSHALSISENGEWTRLPETAARDLPRTGWGLSRHTRLGEHKAPAIRRSLEDGPFYARALLDVVADGKPAIAMHECLAAQRLPKRWVQFCIRHRLRRVD